MTPGEDKGVLGVFHSKRQTSIRLVGQCMESYRLAGHGPHYKLWLYCEETTGYADVYASLVDSQILTRGLCFVYECVWRRRRAEGGNQLNNEYNSQTGSLCFL